MKEEFDDEFNCFDPLKIEQSKRTILETLKVKLPGFENLPPSEFCHKVAGKVTVALTASLLQDNEIPKTSKDKAGQLRAVLLWLLQE